MDNKEHRFFTLSVDDVARLLDKTPASLRQDIAKRPHCVPPRLQLPGRRILFLREDVLAWLRGFSTMQRAQQPAPTTAERGSNSAQKRGRGRPPKLLQGGA